MHRGSVVLGGLLLAALAVSLSSLMIVQRKAEGLESSLITPTGKRLFEASQQWMTRQHTDPRYQKEATCAANLSNVFEDVNLNKYTTLWAPSMERKMRQHGAKTFSLSRNGKSFVENLNRIHASRLPVGTLISGCYSKGCSGPSGSRHVALVGEEVDGIIYLHHNNYYIPRPGEPWKAGMVDKALLEQGIERQWMRTPWVRVTRGEHGQILTADILLPRMIGVIDPRKAHVRATIPEEILREIADGEAFAVSAGSIQYLGDLAQGPDTSIKSFVRELTYGLGPVISNSFGLSGLLASKTRESLGYPYATVTDTVSH